MKMKCLSLWILVCAILPVSAQSNQESLSGTQKAYKIGSNTWYFELPKEYKIRQDQFSETIELGAKEIESNGQGATASGPDEIIIAAGRSDSSNLNVLLVSSRNDKMITQFGVKGYRDKLIEFFQYSYEADGSNFQVTMGEELIDSKLFYSMEHKMLDTENKYIYSTMMFIAKVSDKELSFSLIFDNPEDKELLLNSLRNSHFEK